MTARASRRDLVGTANPDAKLIALCEECCKLVEESHILFRKSPEDDSKEQIANEAACGKLDDRSRILFERIRIMAPSTPAGQQAVAKVALWHVGRDADETTIETNYIGEGLAWMLVRQLAGGDRWSELNAKPCLAGEMA